MKRAACPGALALVFVSLACSLTACGGGGGGGGSSASPTLPTVLVSVDSNGTRADNDSVSPSTSSDGRYVAFVSFATNLVANDTNGANDIFVRDTVSGTTERVSENSAGGQADSASIAPSISSDGRYVAFSSDATDLVAGDTNGSRDIFLHDRQTHTTTRVSVDPSGAESDNASDFPSISSDGRYVAFQSDATNLVANDTNASTDIFVRDTQTNTTVRVSVNDSGAEGASNSFSPSISANGRYIAFHSFASNLATGDTNGFMDIFVRDTLTNTTARVSVDSHGAEGDNDSVSPSISSDGRYVAFQSDAANLVSGDTNGSRDVFVHDTQTHTTSRASVDSAGAQADNISYSPSISSDGRYVAFVSSATNLVAGDTNAVEDIFVHDAQTGVTSRASVDSAGAQADNFSYGPSMCPDGSHVAFYSFAANLASGDTNGFFDVFLAVRR